MSTWKIGRKYQEPPGVWLAEIREIGEGGSRFIGAVSPQDAETIVREHNADQSAGPSSNARAAATRLLNELTIHPVLPTGEGAPDDSLLSFERDVETVARALLAAEGEAGRLAEAVEAIQGTGDVMLHMLSLLDTIPDHPAAETMKLAIVFRLGANGGLINAWKAAGSAALAAAPDGRSEG